MRKYKLDKQDFIKIDGKKLFRIVALKDFSNVKKGDKGGYVESYDNLSQDGNTWIYDNARVYGNAEIYDSAKIYGQAEIYGNAKVWGNAEVYGNAMVYDYARIFGNAWVYENAEIYGEAGIGDNAQIFGNARIFGNAQVYENAIVHENARIFGNAQVYGGALVYGNVRIFGNAWVYGNARVCKNARVYGKATIKYGYLDCNIFENIKQYIACSLDIYPVNGKYILYKSVNKTNKEGVYQSIYDPNFIYKIGEYAEVKNYDRDKLVSCGEGIHVSTPFYWSEGDTLIAVEVDINDIITCMDGKLRVKKVKVLEEIKR